MALDLHHGDIAMEKISCGFDGQRGNTFESDEVKHNTGDAEDPKSLIDMGDLPVDMGKQVEVKTEWGSYSERAMMTQTSMPDGDLDEGVSCIDPMYPDRQILKHSKF